MQYKAASQKIEFQQEQSVAKKIYLKNEDRSNFKQLLQKEF